VDAARGVAVMLMAFYHLVYDLARFGELRVEPGEGGWRVFADAIATLFLLLVGVSLCLSAFRSDPRSFLARQARRGLLIFAAGLLVTGATRLLIPDVYVRFGILHLIGVSVLLAAPYARLPLAALPLGVAFLAAGAVLRSIRLDHPWLLWLGLRPDPFLTTDYRPLAPWFGVVLIGIVFGHLLYGDRRGVASRLPGWERWPVWRPVRFLGRHALVVYLVHQPLLVVGLWALGLIDLGGRR